MIACFSHLWRLHSQDVVFAQIGMNQFANLKHAPHGHNHLCVDCRHLLFGNFRVFESGRCTAVRLLDCLCDFTHAPSIPKNSITSTFSLHSITLGVLTPPCSSRLKFRSSFSAQTRIILRGFLEDEYSPRNRCSPSMYACLDRKLRMEVR